MIGPVIKGEEEGWPACGTFGGPCILYESSLLAGPQVVEVLLRFMAEAQDGETLSLSKDGGRFVVRIGRLEALGGRALPDPEAARRLKESLGRAGARAAHPSLGPVPLISGMAGSEGREGTAGEDALAAG